MKNKQEVKTKMENEMQAQWSCPKCGTINSPTDMFCKKCGNAKNVMPGTLGVESGSSWKKGVIIAISVLALLGIVVAGGYYFYVSKQKKDAKAYLDSESKAFAESINLVNALSTEKDLGDDDKKYDNLDLFFKKIEEEKNNSDKAVAGITAVKVKNETLKPNKFVAGIDKILKGYYEGISRNIEKYNKYLAYGLALTQEERTVKAEADKLQQIFKNPSSVEEASKMVKEFIAMETSALERYRNIPEPDGYQEIKQKSIAEMEKLINIFSDFSKAIDSKDTTKVIQAGDAIDEFFEDDTVSKEIEELEKYFFEQMHKSFESSRKDAENVKTEFVRAGFELKAEIPTISVEGW